MGLVIGLVAIGCSGEPKEGDCVELSSGDWTFEGTSVGMEMGMVVAMDAAGCTFALSDWDMTMGSVPEGGSLVGDEVTLSGGDDWSGCTGTASADGASVSGACEDGSTWSMAEGTMTMTSM